MTTEVEHYSSSSTEIYLSILNESARGNRQNTERVFISIWEKNSSPGACIGMHQAETC